MEMYDFMKENSTEVQLKIEDLHQKFDCDMRKAIRSLDEKNTDIENAARELERSRNVEAKLRSDIGILVAQLKDKDKQITMIYPGSIVYRWLPDPGAVTSILKRYTHMKSMKRKIPLDCPIPMPLKHL
jgi:hypothetical protein